MKYFITKLLKKGEPKYGALCQYTDIKDDKYIGLRVWFKGKWTKDDELHYHLPKVVYQRRGPRNTVDSFIDIPIDASKIPVEIRKIKKLHSDLEKLKKQIRLESKKMEELNKLAKKQSVILKRLLKS